jgi:hypothetical protein
MCAHRKPDLGENMKRKMIGWASCCVAGTLSLAISTESVHSGELFRRNTRTRVCYGSWPGTSNQHYSVDKVADSGRVVLAQPASEPSSLAPKSRQVKRFFAQPTTNQVAAGQVVMTQFGAEMHRNGNHAVTGELAFVPDPERSREGVAFRGATARIRVRAYAGVPQQEAVQRSAILFETTQKAWVPANDSVAMSLIPATSSTRYRTPSRQVYLHTQAPANLSTTIRDSFDRITHVEIVIDMLERP